MRFLIAMILSAALAQAALVSPKRGYPYHRPTPRVRVYRRAGGSVYVHGYTKKDGTVVAPYIRSAPTTSR